MPDYLNYQKSVAAEFKALEKRVRYLIDDSHWGEEGRYKEAILVNFLKRILPKHLSVGTGFVRNNNNITNQIDIIIYENNYPLFFMEGDFIITAAENVVGIIEVKSSIEAGDLCDIIHKANRNGKIIVGSIGKSIFNGIFSYNAEAQVNTYINAIDSENFDYITQRQHFNQFVSDSLYSCVNHIAIGNKFFVKLWPLGQGEENQEYSITDFPKPYYSMYEMPSALAYPYFFSNLQEHLINITTGRLNHLSDDLKKFFYPIENGKESHLVRRILLEK